MLIEFYRHEYDEKRLFVYILVFMILNVLLFIKLNTIKLHVDINKSYVETRLMSDDILFLS